MSSNPNENPVVQQVRLFARETHARALAAAGRLHGSTRAWTGIALAGVALLSVNLIATTTLRDAKLDLTQEGLFTISEGTRKALRGIDEPIKIRAYFSKKLGDASPAYAKNFQRVRSLLDQYRDISGGNLEVSFLDPEPFSDAEDLAVAAGLRSIRLNQEGDVGYFGLAGTNATDNEATIPFFAPERERFLEYDITKLIYSLSNPKKRVVGLMSSLPIDGGMMPGGFGGPGRPMPAQLVMDQIREFFDVKTIEKDAKEIPSDVDVLMLVQPDGLSAATAYAIDQFALAGGRVLAFVDPASELDRMSPPGLRAGGGDKGEFARVLKSWGIAYDPAKVATDIAHARRVQFGGGARANVTEYVAWLGLDKGSLDDRDVVAGGIERLNVATPGFLEKVEDATTKIAPLLRTSPQAMQVAAEKFQTMPDPIGLLRNYKPEGKQLVIAARVSGLAQTAYPDGRPKDESAAAAATPAKPGGSEGGGAGDKTPTGTDTAATAASAPVKPHVASGTINAVVVADTDLLNDQFWVEVRDFLGQQVGVPHAHNAAFVVGVIENLSGSDALISLRGRGVSDRPFELVNDLRRDAERRFRDKEQELTAKLKEVQGQLAKLERGGEAKVLLVSEQDRQAIERFRTEMLYLRRDLRDVKHELRKDIDRVDGTLKFVNIAAVPLLIGIGGLALAARRRRRKPDA